MAIPVPSYLLLKRIHHRTLFALLFVSYATLIILILRHHNPSSQLLFNRSPPPPPPPLSPSTATPAPPPPPPYSFLRQACRKAHRPADCFAALSEIPSAAVAADGEAVMEILLRHVIASLERSRSRLLRSLEEAATSGAGVRGEVLSECSDFVETGLRVLRGPGRVSVNPGPAEALSMASFYIFTCIRLVKDIEDGFHGPSLESYVRSLLDGADHLCRVGSDFGYRNGFGVVNHTWRLPVALPKVGGRKGCL